ncbi:MAG: amidohydrolase family protein [Acidobacteria bacterium]|nr:amidohydrolase family protein [Acidobacteriota bacterium]
MVVRFLPTFLMIPIFGFGMAQQLPAEAPGYSVADLILVNGKVVSMDDRGTAPNTPGRLYQAIAIKGKKIMALGTDEAIKKLANSATRTIDLQGKTVIPGIIESHAHTYGNAFSQYGPKVGLVVPGIKLSVDTQKSAEATAKAIRETVVNAIQTQKLPKGEWISVSLRDSDQARQYSGGIWLYLGKINRKSLDPATRDYPVIVSTGLRNLYNGKAIEEVRRFFPEWDEHADSENRPGAAEDGYEGIMTNAALGPELWWKDEPVEKIAEVFRMHGEQEIQKWGVTTISTRVPPPRYIAAYYLLNRQGRMPYRLAYAIEVHRGRLLGLDSTRELYQTVAGQWNTMSSGGEMLWCHGMANEMWDSLNVEMCFGPDLTGAPEVKAMERCVTPDSKPWVSDKAAILNGWRAVGTHTTASHGLRLFIQMLDEAAKEGNLSTEYIRSTRPTGEHAIMLGAAPDLIAGMKKYGIILSIGPRFLVDVVRTMEDYGEGSRRLAAPVKTYIKEGIPVVGQMDSASWNDYSNHWIGMYTFITRKAFPYNKEGVESLEKAPIILPEEAIDRVTALKMWTIWAASYVLAEDNLGSLEPGKYADFAVLDRDYFTIPESEIPKVRIVMTGLNGRIVYNRDNLASAK